MERKVLIIDNDDQSEQITNIITQASKKGIIVDISQFNVGSPQEPTLLDENGNISIPNVIQEYKNRFYKKRFDIIACDWQLSDSIDGIELLRRMEPTLRPFPKILIYSGLLNQILDEIIIASVDIDPSTGKKTIQQSTCKYIKHLIQYPYIGFVEREEYEKNILNHLSDETSISQIFEDFLDLEPDAIMKYGFGHNLEGKKLNEIKTMINNNPQLNNDVKTDLIIQTLIYLSSFIS